MVSAGHPLVASVAVRVLERGGTAVDAGVAAGLATNVVQSDMANFGGIAPILIRPAGSGTVWNVSGVGTWGRSATVDAFRERFGREMPLGAPIAVVPAAPDAWITALARFGTWTFGDVAAPAIELAADGFALDVRTARSLEILGRGFSQWPSSAAIYWPNGRPPHAGECLRQPDLARLLQWLADAEVGRDRVSALEQVRRAFYEGMPAERVVSFVSAEGGWLTRDDLGAFRNEVTSALSRQYARYRVYTSGFWSQGPVLLQALALLDGFDLAGFGHNTADYLHCLVESLKLAFSDRERYYGDPQQMAVDGEWLLSDSHARELRDRIRSTTALPNLPTVRAGLKRCDTTSFCIIDAAGNVFSATPSDTLDGGPIVPGLGIIVSPRGVQSRLDPSHPAAIGPGRRPRVTPAPALALKPTVGEPMLWAFGSPGGDVIVQAMLQSFLNCAVFGLTPQQAVEAPRAATFSFPDSFYPHTEVQGRVSVESRIAEPIRADLEARGHRLHVWPDFEFDAGAVSMVLDLIEPSKGRVLVGAADPRRTCYAFGR